MNINNLPFDVLSHVFKIICSKDFIFARSWKHRLNFLSVCRKWRQIALPMIYKDVVVVLHDSIWSNMDIMPPTAVEYSHRLYVQVELKYNDPAVDMQIVLHKLQSKKEILSRITCLSLDISMLGHDSVTFRERELQKTTLQEVAKMFKRLLPNISTLLVEGFQAWEGNTTFLSALYSQYASQLERATIDPLALVSTSKTIHFSNLLTSLNLHWLDSPNPAPATFDISCLTKVWLRNVSDSFKWSMFSVDNKDFLVFPALLYLNISVSPQTYNSSTTSNGNTTNAAESRDRFGYKLVTPRLRCLEISVFCPFALSILMSISTADGSPLLIEKLHIRTLDDARFTFYGFCFSPATTQLFEKYFHAIPPPYTEEHAQDHRNATNRLVGDLQNTKDIIQQEMHVSIGHRVTYINSLEETEYFCWPHVTKLTIDSPISLTNLLGLIESKIPNLVALEVYNISVEVHDDDDDSMLVPELLQSNFEVEQQHALVGCKHLKSLVYGFDTYNNVPPELSDRFEEFMFGAIKTLKYCLQKPAYQW